MAFSINIRSDNDSANAIRSLWRQCSALEKTPSMEALNYPPHITLAVFDEIDSRPLYAAFDAVFASVPPISLRFENLDHFVTPNAVVLWAAPSSSQQLKLVHHHLHSLLTAEQCRSTYLPGTWVPHCTLASTIASNRKVEAIDFARQAIDPFEVHFDVADCASFVPVEVLRERTLTPGI